MPSSRLSLNPNNMHRIGCDTRQQLINLKLDLSLLAEIFPFVVFNSSVRDLGQHANLL